MDRDHGRGRVPEKADPFDMSELEDDQSAADLPTDRSSSPTSTAPSTRRPPTSFNEVPGEPLDIDLTLLSSEPVEPGLVSREEHAQKLLGYGRQEMTDREWYADFMHSLYVGIQRHFFDKMRDAAKEKDTIWYTRRGIENPEDLLVSDKAQGLSRETFKTLLLSDPLDEDELDRILAEELYVRDLLALEYLERLPTEPEPDIERFERLDTRLSLRQSWLRTGAGRRKSLMEGEERVNQRKQNTRDRQYHLAVWPEVNSPKEIDYLLLKLREALSEREYHNLAIVDVGKYVLMEILDDFSNYYLSIITTKDLNNIAYEEVEELFCKRPYVEFCRERWKWFCIENDPLGPYCLIQTQLAETAYHKYGAIHEQDYNRLK